MFGGLWTVFKLFLKVFWHLKKNSFNLKKKKNFSNFIKLFFYFLGEFGWIWNFFSHFEHDSTHCEVVPVFSVTTSSGFKLMMKAGCQKCFLN
jgi:hypothetical protein